MNRLALCCRPTLKTMGKNNSAVQGKVEAISSSCAANDNTPAGFGQVLQQNKEQAAYCQDLKKTSGPTDKSAALGCRRRLWGQGPRSQRSQAAPWAAPSE